jgi:hypothetical protein
VFPVWLGIGLTKKKMKTIQYILSIAFVMCAALANAQGLEGIVVERYYQTDAADAANATAEGATVPLPAGTTVYRVYVDMAAGYEFVQLFGNATNNLEVNSTSNFYNDPVYGVSVNPGTISTTNIRRNTAMIDSWFTTGGTANGKAGVLKSDDSDGTLGHQDGLLANNAGGCFGFPIMGGTGRDGMVNQTAGTYVVPNTLGLGSALDVLNQTPGNSIVVTSGAIAALGGIVGPTSANRVLVGQFTTNGTFTFKLNVQLLNPVGVAENYVHTTLAGGQLTHPTLTRGVNIAPTVNVTAPSNGATLATGSSVTISANAGDVSGGSISQVEFFVNGTSIGVDPTAPYFVNWIAVAGSAAITAVATDNDCTTTTSVTVNATVGGVTTPTNDFWQGPVPMIVPNFPSCITTSGTLVGCAPSAESAYFTAPVGAGQDTWYRFRVPAGSSGTVRIQVNAANNIAILLQREETVSPFYTAIAQENVNSASGNEIMIAQGLTVGQWYRVGIKNMTNETLGGFTICINSIRTVGCTANSASPRVLCDSYSCSFTGANSYTYTFTNTLNPLDFYTKTLTGTPASTNVFLSTVPGIAYGTTYDVRVDATYALANGVGTVSNVVVNGTNGICQLIMAPQPSIQLNSADWCANSQKVRSSVISTSWVCGVIDYTWEITPNTGLPVAVTTDRGAPDRFIRVNSLTGINSGAVSFNVRVRPVFSDGAGGRRNGAYGPVQELCLVAPITIAENRDPQPMERPEERALQVENSTSIECYPNPVSSESVWVSVYDVVETPVAVRLTDVTGKRVIERTYSTGNSFIQQEIRVGDLPAGLYLMQVDYNGKSNTLKVIVQ